MVFYAINVLNNLAALNIFICYLCYQCRWCNFLYFVNSTYISKFPGSTIYISTSPSYKKHGKWTLNFFTWEIVNNGFSWENIFLINIASAFKASTVLHFSFNSAISAISSLTLWSIAMDVDGGIQSSISSYKCQTRLVQSLPPRHGHLFLHPWLMQMHHQPAIKRLPHQPHPATVILPPIALSSLPNTHQ